MPGMNVGVDANDPTVVAAFRAALAHQGLIALLIIAILSIVWVAVREQVRAPAAAGPPAAAGREVLRVGFGLLWLLDAALLTQSSMAAGLPSDVIEPTAADSPAWVQHLINWAGTTWSYHPVQAAAAAVWIEAGIGLWLLAARRGKLSRLAGAVSLGWGLIVWVFGESFGGLFAPGLTWLSGAPGAALLYCAAGVLLLLPERWWRTPRLGTAVLGLLGVFLIGMAVLQSWPGRGFWQGTVSGQPGTLASILQVKAETSQPSAISGLVSGFATFTSAHGLAVNLVSVIALAALGAAFLTGRRAVVRPAAWVFVGFCAVVWVLVEDLGFFGGLGTNPGSMIPMALLAVAACLGSTRLPQAATAAGTVAAQSAQAPAVAGAPERDAAVPATAEPSTAMLDSAVPEAAASGKQPASSGRIPGGLFRPAGLRRAVARATFGTMASVCALGVIILGVVPMASARADPAASAVLAEAVDGPESPVDYPASDFTLTDQQGQRVSLSSLRGKVVLLTFLDPVCVSDCPLIAQEFRLAGQILGSSSSQVELVAVNLNPLFSQLAYIRAFDQQENLANVPNWRYLTGTDTQLKKIYAAYGVASETLPAGAMLGHSDIAFVINRSGTIVNILDFDPGPGTPATQSSFAAELASAAVQSLQAS